MSLSIVQGDILQTSAQAILLGLNLRGQASVNPLETRLRDVYPVFFSEYRRLGRNSAFTLGDLWFFKEAQPWLLGALLYQSASSTLRLRHMEQVIYKLYQTYEFEGLQSLAIAPFSDPLEWAGLLALLQDRLSNFPLPVLLYEAVEEPKA